METKKHPWISCIEQLQAISQEFEQCNEILNNVKNSKFPNPVLFLINSIEYISSIRNGICDHISYATKALDDLMIGNEHDNISAKDSFVEDDPGKRIHNLTILQRQFLISLGPHQPKLARYPRDNNIPVNKQQHFTPIWFNEFPMLEYCIVADSVFCFVCSLFSQINENNVWVNSGVRQWQKMKSRGKLKKGKLSQHFSSVSHKRAMLDYCAFTSQ